MILLTNEEIGKVLDAWTDGKTLLTGPQALAKAQLKKVVEWLEGRSEIIDGLPFFSMTLEEWQALLEEVK